jgi:hypothetical protein
MMKQHLTPCLYKPTALSKMNVAELKKEKLDEDLIIEVFR